ncbi:MAG: type I methionyl aminopeptidase [Candidatus Omnitrophica bacterium]|nr:type I methionyl aminopeptidase [Candidatus Omnitrophota bacterium]MBU1523265.1 type I methionyl aminopeptidase [Candidatus Omnitrophota bacterium]MBU2436699.1 type I methionyl aminopeptidase [Candidatus Omnitrophota bacterium]MBU2504635.1 type I methionyl aminopeptidase [Candidatus Omnitrophota bacterium]
MFQPLSHNELMIMRKAGKAAADILKRLKKVIKPGISTQEIDSFFKNALKGYPGMEAAFRGFRGYPASLCVSVNEEIIHGIPSGRVIQKGDIVSVDLGIKYKGLFVDAAYTYIVGKVSKVVRKLVKVTLGALYVGIKKAKVGAKVGDVGFAIQKFVERNGFSVIRKFVGHGIGKDLHLAPEIPNFGKVREGEELKENYAIAIEPMVSSGSFDVDILGDGWGVKTKDDSLSAHFEHTVAITKKGPWILTQ